MSRACKECDVDSSAEGVEEVWETSGLENY